MALTTEQIDAEAFARWGDMKGAPLAMCRGFARAIEAEVRKEDAQLIQQMRDVLSASSPNTNNSYQWKSEEWAKRRAEAITKANTRLEELQ